MQIIVNHSSMVPIYEQIVEQIKAQIMEGKLQAEAVLPSVRGLAKELRISALTVKKAYDYLEEEGFTVTVHGKGTYVAASNAQRLRDIAVASTVSLSREDWYELYRAAGNQLP